MAYLVSNKEIKNGVRWHNYYVLSDSISDDGAELLLTSNSRNIVVAEPGYSKSELIDCLESYDCFYTIVSLCGDNVEVRVDEIGFEAPFVYQSEDVWCISSELNTLLEHLSSNNLKLSFDEQHLREFLRWGAVISGGTVFEGIDKLNSESRCVLSGGVDLNVIKKEFYFNKRDLVANSTDAANNLYQNIETFFKNQNVASKYCLGMSGGLDSRVAGYFSSRFLNSVSTFFVGNKKSPLGIMTFDAKMAVDVNQKLGFNDIGFIKHDRINWFEKVKGDLENGTESTGNSQINIGYGLTQENDFLINGAMGGELFGACVSGLEDDMTDEEFVDYLYSYVTVLPKQKHENNLIAKVLYKLGLFKDLLKIKPEEYSTVIPCELSQKIKCDLKAWVAMKREAGFSNIKINQLFLYEKLARNHRRGFFYGFNGKIQVVPTYFRPSVIKQMLSWEDSLFVDKKVQKVFLGMCGSIANVRSQNVGDYTAGNLDGLMAKWQSKAERVIRGGGMNYQRWCAEKDFRSQKDQADRWMHRLNISPVVVENSPSIMMNLVKVEGIEKRFNGG